MQIITAKPGDEIRSVDSLRFDPPTGVVVDICDGTVTIVLADDGDSTCDLHREASRERQQREAARVRKRRMERRLEKRRAG